MYPRTSATPSSCLGQVPPWTRSQAGSARAVHSAVMDRAPGRAETRLRSGCLGNEVPALLLRPPGRTAEPGGAYMATDPSAGAGNVSWGDSGPGASLTVVSEVCGRQKLSVLGVNGTRAAGQTMDR